MYIDVAVAVYIYIHLCTSNVAVEFPFLGTIITGTIIMGAIIIGTMIMGAIIINTDVRVLWVP